MPGASDSAARAGGAGPLKGAAAVHDDKGKPALHTAPIESGGEAKPAKVVAQSDDPMIGTTIAGRYRVDARLGEGGMGAVYRVEHTHMRKKLALKVLHREMTS